MINLLHAVACRYKTDVIISQHALQQSKYSGEWRWIGRYKLLQSHVYELDVFEILLSGSKKISYPRFKSALQLYQQGKNQIVLAMEQLQQLTNEFSEDELIVYYYQQCLKMLDKNSVVQESLLVHEALCEPVLNSAFEKFCNSEFCAENVQIWNLVQMYLETKDEQHVTLLFNKFILVQESPTVHIHKEIWDALQVCAVMNTVPSEELLMHLQNDLEHIMAYKFQQFKQTDDYTKSFYASKLCVGAPEVPTIDMNEFSLPD